GSGDGLAVIWAWWCLVLVGAAGLFAIFTNSPRRHIDTLCAAAFWVLGAAATALLMPLAGWVTADAVGLTPPFVYLALAAAMAMLFIGGWSYQGRELGVEQRRDVPVFTRTLGVAGLLPPALLASFLFLAWLEPSGALTTAVVLCTALFVLAGGMIAGREWITRQVDEYRRNGTLPWRQPIPARVLPRWALLLLKWVPYGGLLLGGYGVLLLLWGMNLVAVGYTGLLVWAIREPVHFLPSALYVVVAGSTVMGREVGTGMEEWRFTHPLHRAVNWWVGLGMGLVGLALLFLPLPLFLAWQQARRFYVQPSLTQVWMDLALLVVLFVGYYAGCTNVARAHRMHLALCWLWPLGLFTALAIPALLDPQTHPIAWLYAPWRIELHRAFAYVLALALLWFGWMTHRDREAITGPETNPSRQVYALVALAASPIAVAFAVQLITAWRLLTAPGSQP
ncbi:MAG TPA: hypothetical protein VEI97_10670, partial [bacterium]|nr:hypothetical protein [bacterium]